MAAPIDAAWNNNILGDATLEATTHGSGTTATRTGLGTWEANRPFFDTDLGQWFYNSHASAPSSVTWTPMGSAIVTISSAPATPDVGVIYHHSSLPELLKFDVNKAWWSILNGGHKTFSTDLDIEDDFTSDNFVETGTKNQVNTGTGVLDWDFDNDSTNHKTVFDFTSLAADEIVMRFKFVTDNITFGGGTSGIGYIGAINTDNTVGANSATNSGIYIQTFAVAGPLFRILFKTQKTGSLATGTVEFTFADLSSGTYYIEIIAFSQTSGKCTIYSDAAYTTVVETSGIVALGDDWTDGTTRYFFVGIHDPNTSADVYNGTIDDLVIAKGSSNIIV